LQNPYFYLGFKTSFWNTYRDFWKNWLSGLPL
jgi:hypothetical protein